MISHLDAGSLEHGGDLAAARRLFPHAPQPFIDLSTGINPHPYPLPSLAANVFAQLPDSAAQFRLCEMAARTYGTPTAAHEVCAPGTQILLPLVAALVPPGRAGVLGPTYSEHARAAALAGHAVMDVGDINELRRVDLAVIVNPNNPDGRVVSRAVLADVAGRLRSRGGWLVVDESFADLTPERGGCALCTELPVAVLRSFSKFYGLAGLRLGFLIAPPEIGGSVAQALGPWAVSGPALAIGCRALNDTTWAKQTRARLKAQGDRLDRVLAQAGFAPVGGTDLFRLVRHPHARDIHDRLAQKRIWSRRFDWADGLLRFGLPPDDAALQRLAAALTTPTTAR